MAPIPPTTSSASRLLKLSETISKNTKLLNSYLIEKRLPQPSFAADGPPAGIVIEKDEPRRKELERVKKELVTATKELHDLSIGPREGVRRLAWDVSTSLGFGCFSWSARIFFDFSLLFFVLSFPVACHAYLITHL